MSAKCKNKMIVMAFLDLAGIKIKADKTRPLLVIFGLIAKILDLAEYLLFD